MSSQRRAGARAARVFGAACVLILAGPAPDPPMRVRAQSAPPCASVPIPEPRAADLLFTREQETHLGGLIKAQLELSTRIIDDPTVTAYLRETGDRLVATLGQRDSYRFYLADLAEANAWALPGGSIFVSPKMVALLRSEEELAAVLAHEIGHVATRHGAVSLSRAFRKALRLERVETSELLDRYHDLIESDRLVIDDREEDRQHEADRVAVNVLAAAGYDPSAIATMFERLAQLRKGRGTWFSDLLGSTPPAGKRLRAMAADAPAPCAPAHQPRTGGAFQAWQKAVAHYRGIGHRESLSGESRRIRLQPGLRTGLDSIRISPDGRFVLAQDDSSLALFLRDRLKPLFHIDAEGARRAAFSHDGRRVSFLSGPAGGSPRIEWWDTADGSREIHEIHVAGGCVQSQLSPDGETLVCLTIGDNYNDGLTFDLRVIDVESGELLLERKPFTTPLEVDFVSFPLGATVTAEVRVAGISFSPDGRHVVLGSPNLAVGFDIVRRTPLELPASIKRLVRGVFEFMDDRRIVGRTGSELQIVGFPKGELLLDGLSIGTAVPSAVTRGDSLILAPLKGGLAGIVDVRQRNIVVTFAQRPVDVFEGSYVREREDGSLGMYSLGGAELATAAMPGSRLAALGAGTVSPDGRWLAMSGRGRSGVWDLEQGQRILHLQPLRTAWLGEPGALTAVVRERDRDAHSIVRFDLQKVPTVKAREVGGAGWWLHGGRVVLAGRPANPERPGRDVMLEARDVTTDKVLWSRRFAREAPHRQVNQDTGMLVLVWPLDDGDALELKMLHTIQFGT